MFDTAGIERRSFLKQAAAVAVASTTLAGCGGDGEGGSDGGGTPRSFDGWMDDAKRYDGVVDETGSSSVTVEVGAGDAGLAFDPAGIRIDAGTTVNWEWTGTGGQHNVHAQEGANIQSDRYTEAGQHFSHTFESAATVTYQCDPHVGVGMKGVVVVE